MIVYIVGDFFMNLNKTFDCIAHDLLIANLDLTPKCF